MMYSQSLHTPGEFTVPNRHIRSVVDFDDILTQAHSDASFDSAQATTILPLFGVGIKSRLLEGVFVARTSRC